MHKAALVLCTLGGICLGVGFAQARVDTWWRDELARRGVAHYYLDAENRRQWNWIEPQKVEAKP